MRQTSQHTIVIVGGGFAGLYAAKSLKGFPGRITLVDKRNFHLFQPLLYQVATGGLSPADIASPLRAVLNRQHNTSVLMAEATDILPGEHRLVLRDDSLSYDTLIVATGVSHYYFGNDGWARWAPGLKTLEDALEIRRRVLLAFEAAERESDPIRRQTCLRFVVVGAGPTGVELAGALAELASTTLQGDFTNIEPSDAEILLLEGADRVLPPYRPEVSIKAAASLARLGVTVCLGTLVTDLQSDDLTIRQGGQTRTIQAKTVLWAAGTQASPMGRVLEKRTGAQLDSMGRVIVEPDLTIPGHPDIFVLGDLAHWSHGRETPLAGVAPVAMQEGRYVAKVLKARLRDRNVPDFRYHDRGNLAVIGRHAAVADLGWVRFGGFPAWLSWLLIHITYLIGFDNKLLVLFQWAWNYFTRKRGARLITGDDPFPLVNRV